MVWATRELAPSVGIAVAAAACQNGAGIGAASAASAAAAASVAFENHAAAAAAAVVVVHCIQIDVGGAAQQNRPDLEDCTAVGVAWKCGVHPLKRESVVLTCGG